MFIIRNIPEQKYFVDLKHVTVTPDSVTELGGGPRVVVSTAAFHARARGSVPVLGSSKETKNV